MLSERFRVVGLLRKCTTERCTGATVIAKQVVDDAEIVVCFGEYRVVFDDLMEVPRGLVELADVTEQHARVEARLKQARVDVQRTPVGGSRCSVLLATLQGSLQDCIAASHCQNAVSLSCENNRLRLPVGQVHAIWCPDCTGPP